MPGTYTNLLYHLIFSTKNREPHITDDIREPLYQYIGGIVRAKGGSLMEVGGVEDHIHLLTRFKPTMSVPEAIRLIKSNSSKWLHQDKDMEHFNWQDGYGAFSVSKSKVEDVRRYIRRQPEHHRRRSFREELLEFLVAHEIEFDESFV